MRTQHKESNLLAFRLKKAWDIEMVCGDCAEQANMPQHESETLALLPSKTKARNRPCFYGKDRRHALNLSSASTSDWLLIKRCFYSRINIVVAGLLCHNNYVGKRRNLPQTRIIAVRRLPQEHHIWEQIKEWSNSFMVMQGHFCHHSSLPGSSHLFAVVQTSNVGVS